MINRSKLKKVVQRDGKIEAQCPACAEAGADSKGNHLVLYPDGRFGCVANPNDKEHNKSILRLAGERGFTPLPHLEIRRQTIPDSKVILRVGRPGREKPTPVEPSVNCAEPEPIPAECPVEVTKVTADQMACPIPEVLTEFTTESIRRFLAAP